MHCVAAASLVVCASAAYAQKPTQATYITDAEVRTVLATPGIDHTIRVVDIGNENFAVGIIHRGPSGVGGSRGGSLRSGVAIREGPPPNPCGDHPAISPSEMVPGGITHDSQTEGYFIVSGGGTLVTGGHIVNGTKSAPDAAVTKELNGPSCSGAIAGADVVRRVMKAGDIVIIPAGVPHGWTEIADHVDYLSFRPSDHVLEAGYVHPSIKK